MAKKFKTAQEILVQKGYQANKFDTVGFLNLIAQFFVEHDIKDTILVRSVRFVEIKDSPASGFIDRLDTSVWMNRIEDPNDAFDSCDYILALKKGLVRPTIIVDEPFVKNAMYTAELMGGYVVKKHKRDSYLLSLV